MIKTISTMKSKLKNKLYIIKKKFKRFFLNEEFKIKGHELIQKHEKEIAQMLTKDSVIIEIGSERKAGSTKYLSKLANKNNTYFYTVDIDAETSKAADLIVKKINPDFAAINKPGEEFLQEFDRTLSLVYLDAFDIPGDWLNKEIYDAYKQRGQNLTLENCWKMHYDCAVSITEKMKIGGFVCFDDVNPVDDKGNLLFKKVENNYPKWSGKGETAIPYLLQNGFELIDNKRASALLKKIK